MGSASTVSQDVLVQTHPHNVVSCPSFLTVGEHDRQEVHSAHYTNTDVGAGKLYMQFNHCS